MTWTLPRDCQRRAWIEAWELERQVEGAHRWFRHREGPPDMLVHPRTGTVHVLGPIAVQTHGLMSLDEFVSWPGELGALALEHVVAYGATVSLYDRLQRADELCGRDTVILCERVGAQVGSCGREVPRATGSAPPDPVARVCGWCVRRTPGWSADELRARAIATHEARTAEDVASAARVAANLGVSA